MKTTWLAVGLCAAVVTGLQAQTSVETLRKASPADLAGSYRELVQIATHVPLVEGGGTLHLPDRTVTLANLEEFKADLANRRNALQAEIDERGYVNVAGTYVPTMTSECKRIPSGWTQSIAQGAVTKVVISQKAFELLLVQEFTIEGTPGTFEIPAVVVDSTLAFDDMMNSDFGFIGKVVAATITVRPQVDDILQAWPDWVKAPNKKDLSRCEVSLVRIDR